jgi:hypothetical protein
VTEQQAAAIDLSPVIWRKSSRTQANGQCVELADLAENVAVRDSKDPSGPVLLFGSADWGSFLESIKRGEVDANGRR